MARLTDLFKRRDGRRTERLEVTGRPATFTAFSGDPYSNDVFRAGVDAIARLAAKFLLTPVVRFSDGTSAQGDDRLARLLQVEPNPLMTAYDLLYMQYTHLYLHNNSYVYVHREGGRVVGLYPVHVSHCDYTQDQAGNVYCEFTFANGRAYTLPYRDVIHLRRHFNSADVEGDPNDAIAAGVELADVQNQGIRNAIKTAGSIRGIVHFTQIMSADKLKEQKEAFVKDYLSLENSGGIAAVDQSMEYTPIEQKPLTISKEDQDATKAKIYNYLGIGESIVNSTFTDDEFGAFDEAVIEALALQTELEYTRKIYTPEQIAGGRKIDCSTSRLHFINNARKVELLNSAVPMGVITINQALDLMGLPPIAEDRRIQSLNYASAELVDQYQLFKAGNGAVHSMSGDFAGAPDDDGTENDPTA
ncbi:phage portal protein, HK97 family [Slackia heliotrinireducens]|uniref:Phage portal protein, HK97 family n=1 Tax=Slackia heliotrinireducens (strain ATCC 29202 / DSM 20476 / NCTC 11029 / RHS 1) TaxID=471855 RepID=C7N4P6_SLAHD|nr:phage portal protein [Slackia heliotrinireducens]ACV21881.1 phage portal protein, HK97 family [Slackia heliotrinireducens DSM 20476]VEG99659.1 phage portal protein, HK97 family [Slackia heliotrinireducens]